MAWQVITQFFDGKVKAFINQVPVKLNDVFDEYIDCFDGTCFDEYIEYFDSEVEADIHYRDALAQNEKK